MKLADLEVKTEAARGKFRIYPVGDLHSDSLAFDEARFRSYIEFIAQDGKKSKSAIALVVGDYCEGRVPGQKHFDPASLIPEARQRLGDYVSYNLDRAEKLLSPLRKAGVPTFLWAGNHDHYMEYSGFTAMLADRLKAVFMGDEGMIRLRVGPARGRDCLTLYGTHGSGGAGLPGAKVNAMQRIPQWVDADLIIAGHVHDGMVRIVPRLGVAARGGLRLIERPVALVRAPAFVKRAVAGVNTYASRKGYPTADEGLQYVESVARGGGGSHKGENVPMHRIWVRHEFCS